MKILVINGDCIQTNTSANLCHVAYINGLVNAGHEVTLLSADRENRNLDTSISIPSSVKHYTYRGMTLYEKLSLKKRDGNRMAASPLPGNQAVKKGVKGKIIAKAKFFVLSCYGLHGIYAKFVKKAQKFRSEVIYDYILSISTPVTSHLLAHNLIKACHIQGKHWIQIWEDPWYSDAYGFNGLKKIYKEEKRLLSFAEKVCYVSPLTLANQKKLFPESANKMYWQPLPYYYESQKTKQETKKNCYGYFGDYAPVARDLFPFYQAAKQTGIQVNICGNPQTLFSSTENIAIHPRLPLKELKPIEDATNVLVFLCNRKGGQIPGKIYQYSATYKTILFILDGTEEEKRVLRDYFEKFDRYVFCDNNEKDIIRAIQQIEHGKNCMVKNEPIEYFSPEEAVNRILEGCK